jgi:DNA (cytosine-5)-methyltransferase 1
MAAYYNEFDPKAAAWLRELIKEGLIPDGFVDERSIADVQPGDLAGYDQCHFFAGIGGWSHALRLSGWLDDRPVWTGSCPCQPFSAAGKGLGNADKRHLWPQFARLIGECRPPVVLGEQVASALGKIWLSRVRADLEEMGYAVGAADLCSASVGAPHIRQRLYWVAYGDGQRFAVGSEQNSGAHESRECPSRRTDLGGSGGIGGLADHQSQGRPGMESERAEGFSERSRIGSGGPGRGLEQPDSLGSSAGVSEPIAGHEGIAGVTDDSGDQASTRERERRTAWLVHPERTGLEGHSGHEDDRYQPRWIIQEPGRPAPEAGAACFWSPSDPIECTDGKSRRVEPGTFPLAHGIPGRVGLLRGYGNAINPELAAEFIQAAEEAFCDPHPADR